MASSPCIEVSEQPTGIRVKRKVRLNTAQQGSIDCANELLQLLLHLQLQWRWRQALEFDESAVSEMNVLYMHLFQNFTILLEYALNRI